ncbi:MAG: YciI family protein [Acidimicrobiia bacterium]
MRVMVLMPADKNSEAGVLPDEKLIAGMVKYNEDLVKAGVMLAGEGLQPSSKGARVKFSGTKRTVIDGPFTETKELIAGYWLWQVKTLDEAIEWVKRLPDYLARAGWTPPEDYEGDFQIEIRPVFETEEFAAELSPELREQVTEQETRIREAAAKAKS